MGAITGQGESYNLPNFVGELFNVSPTDTPVSYTHLTLPTILRV